MTRKVYLSYPSLRHEAASLQAIRVAHFVPSAELAWSKSYSDRHAYWGRLMNKWANLKPFCLLSAEVEKLYLFNPTDLGRWVGGGPFAVPIEGCRRSHLLPAAFVLTACGGIEIDSYLRDYLSNHVVDDRNFEVMSWMGFRPKDHSLYEDDRDLETPADLKSSFRRTGRPPISQHVALILFQCREPQNLDEIDKVFKGLEAFDTGDRDGLQWRPAIVGLLKGNVDAFAVLERVPRERPDNDGSREFDELVIGLESQRRPGFWAGIRPVAIYGSNDARWVNKNWCLLDDLPGYVDPPDIERVAPKTPLEPSPMGPREQEGVNPDKAPTPGRPIVPNPGPTAS